MRTSAKQHLYRGVLVTLSLVPAPLLVFVSTSASLYLQNQRELHHQVVVLLPFLKLFLAAVGLGVVAYAFSHFTLARWVVWCFYLGTPFLLGYAAIGELAGTSAVGRAAASPEGALIGLFLWPLLAGALALSSRWRRAYPVPAFAALGLVFLAYDGLRFAQRYEPGTPAEPATQLGPWPTDPAAPLPNIYHILLDEYDTEWFLTTLTESDRKELGGFVFFRQNEALYHDTPMSLASIFSGRPYAYDRSRAVYTSGAFNGRISLLPELQSRGYRTVAYVPESVFGRGSVFAELHGGGHRGLDRIVYHHQNGVRAWRDLSARAFRHLWLYSHSPESFRERLRELGVFGWTDEEAELLAKGRFLPAVAPVVSRMGFLGFLDEEARLPASHRYTFAHLLVPHLPAALGADCTYTPRDQATVFAQAQCANRLIIELVHRLKELDRFDASLIVIHGDHGSHRRVDGSPLSAWHHARSLRTLLLIKPPGRGDRGPLVFSDRPVTLLDLAPTVVGLVDPGDPGRSRDGALVRRVPPLEGETRETALRLLERKDLSLGRVHAFHSFRFPAGTVVAQRPRAFARLAAGSADGESKTVSLLVSLGPPPEIPVMPDLLGHPLSDAREVARRLGLEIADVRRVDYAGLPKEVVVRQSPPVGAALDDVRQVLLYVSRGW